MSPNGGSDRNKLFRGESTCLHNQEQSNIVRIFISSTFSGRTSKNFTSDVWYVNSFLCTADMSVERNWLLEKAYPDLRSFCQKRGLDFQVRTFVTTTINNAIYK